MFVQLTDYVRVDPTQIATIRSRYSASNEALTLVRLNDGSRIVAYLSLDDLIETLLKHDIHTLYNNDTGFYRLTKSGDQ